MRRCGENMSVPWTRAACVMAAAYAGPVAGGNRQQQPRSQHPHSQLAAALHRRALARSLAIFAFVVNQWMVNSDPHDETGPRNQSLIAILYSRAALQYASRSGRAENWFYIRSLQSSFCSRPSSHRIPLELTVRRTAPSPSLNHPLS